MGRLAIELVKTWQRGQRRITGWCEKISTSCNGTEERRGAWAWGHWGSSTGRNRMDWRTAVPWYWEESEGGPWLEEHHGTRGLSFVMGLVTRIVEELSPYDAQEELSAELIGCLSTAVRLGFDTPEKLSFFFKHPNILCRVRAHTKFAGDWKLGGPKNELLPATKIDAVSLWVVRPLK